MTCTYGKETPLGIVGGHDWVLAFPPEALSVSDGKPKALSLLWACPCGEFRWTNYAEWEKAQEPTITDNTISGTTDGISVSGAP